MKNKFIILFISLFFFKPLMGETLNIQSSNITIDKKTRLSIFKDNVVVTDINNNILKTNYAEYEKDQERLISKGETNIVTSEGFVVSGENILFDNKNNIIKSSYPALVTDLENNNIFLQSFEYSTRGKFFKSQGTIKIIDSQKNSYNFSQIYIDEIKKEIIGTDTKVFLNEQDFKISSDNKPRIFSNTVNIKDGQSNFTKSVFTLCDYRENDKCPPWLLQASKMTHDKKKKTIYYDNAVVKIYDLPIFYFPKLSHPDPTVDRRSGFLVPSISNTKNLGTGFEIPYFWALGKDKDITFNNKLYSSEHPLFLGVYRHAFEKSNLKLDSGYTAGYRKTTATKKAGDKSHLFAKWIKDFKGKNNSENRIELNLQNVSDDKYLKLHRLKSDLTNYNQEVIENSLKFLHEDDNMFLGAKATIYETLKSSYNDKYEYILPEITLDTNLFSSERYGNADLEANLKLHKYDTNKLSKFLVNDIDWRHKEFNLSPSIKSRLLGKIKNVNSETKNISIYEDVIGFKKDQTNELFGALGFLSKIDLYKKTNNNSNHFLTPKVLLRYAPGHMRKMNDNAKLDSASIFTLDRLKNYYNFEKGLSTTVGFDYEVKKANKTVFNFSLGQIINEKENKEMPSSSSLDEKLSDVIGSSSLKINENLKFNYDFSLDQNYNDLNRNSVGANINFDPIKFDFNYLEEGKHIGNRRYFKTNIEWAKSDNGVFTYETKRNLVTNSSEYYNLSYEYLNDCLRAGLVYRREFYNDSEIEADNSLMFKITLIPFGNINGPKLNN